MVLPSLLLLSLLAQSALCLPRAKILANTPSSSWLDYIPEFIRNAINVMPGGSETPDSFIIWDPTNPGSGPFPAKAYKDPGLPRHTIYAPVDVDKSKKLPVILWGNGGCLAVGTMFSGFHTNLASHGYIVIANGYYKELPSVPKGQLIGDYHSSPLGSLFRSAPPGSTSAIPAFLGGMTNSDWQAEALKWVEDGAALAKYGTPDVDRIGAAGQSCGGFETYSLAKRTDKLKSIAIFNSGWPFGGSASFEKFKMPVGIFNGGPADIAYANGETDFVTLPGSIPVVKANIDAGHLGTFFARNGGKVGEIAVAYWDATLKDNKTARAEFTSNGPFFAQGWNVTTRNWYQS